MVLPVDAKTRPNTNMRPNPSRSVVRDSHRRLEKKDPREDAVHQHGKRGPGSRAADGRRARTAPSARRFGRVSARIIVVAVALIALAVPSAASARTAMDLSSHWNFHLGDVPGAQAPGFDDSSWQTVDLPHTWNALDAQDGGTFAVNTYHRGVAWYRKTLTTADSMRGQRSSCSSTAPAASRTSTSTARWWAATRAHSRASASTSPRRCATAAQSPSRSTTPSGPTSLPSRATSRYSGASTAASR